MVSKTAEDNIALMRRLLRLEKSDALAFENEDGIAVVPDYYGLKDSDGSRVKIMVFIKRNDGELVESLANENRGMSSSRRRRRFFKIFEDEAVKRWQVGREDWNMKEHCPCVDCMLSTEHDAYCNHLEAMAEENGWEVSSSVPTEWEEDEEEEDEIEESSEPLVVPSTEDAMQADLSVDTEHVEVPPGNAEQVNAPGDIEPTVHIHSSVDIGDTARANLFAELSDASPRPFNDHGMASVEGEYHYGRIIPGAVSYGIPRSRAKKPSTSPQNLVPSEQDYRSAASVLRRMR
jgi:hypothetical protein